jgi:hypothetical protein
MKQVRFLLLLVVSLSVVSMYAQPRFKGKPLDTTQALLGDDTTLKKLIEFKDSLATVGPAEEGPRPLETSDTTWMIALIIGSVLLIVWAGRRAWLRQRR